MPARRKGYAITAANEQNQRIIDEYRANAGKVGGPFAGIPWLLLTTTGAKSGKQTISPMAYTVAGDRLLVYASAAAWISPGGQPATPFTGEQTPTGFAALPRRLQATALSPTATLVVLEATGSDWVALAVARHEAGDRVAVVDPRQAHHCAKAQLRRAKTDALDARDLTQRAAALRPAPRTPPPAVYHEARQRLVARDGLLTLRTQARHQRHALLQWPVVVAAVREHRDALIADLDRRVAALEAESAAVRKERVWAESLACLTSAPGIGLVTASWLLVGTLHFALCAGPEALTADAGLAPVPRESGRGIRGRPAIGHDGNGRLRTALSRATRSAARHNPPSRPATSACAPPASRSRWRAAPPPGSCCTRPGRAAVRCNGSTRITISTTTIPCPTAPLDRAARDICRRLCRPPQRVGVSAPTRQTLTNAPLRALTSNLDFGLSRSLRRRSTARPSSALRGRTALLPYRDRGWTYKKPFAPTIRAAPAPARR